MKFLCCDRNCRLYKIETTIKRKTENTRRLIKQNWTKESWRTHHTNKRHIDSIYLLENWVDWERSSYKYMNAQICSGAQVPFGTSESLQRAWKSFSEVGNKNQENTLSAEILDCRINVCFLSNCFQMFKEDTQFEEFDCEALFYIDSNWLRFTVAN